MDEKRAQDLQGPHPDTAVDENLDIVESETDPGLSPHRPDPDPPVDDNLDVVEEASEESFPASDAPASWAGADD